MRHPIPLRPWLAVVTALAMPAAAEPPKVDASWVPNEVRGDWADPDHAKNRQGAPFQGGALESVLFRRPEGGGPPQPGAVVQGLGPGNRVADVTVVSVASKSLAPGQPAMTLYELRGLDGKNPCAGRGAGGDAALVGKAVSLPGAWGRGGARVQPGGTGRFFTFGCFDGAIAKCVALGFRADVDPAQATIHEACVRMERADYCGSGRAFTCEGADVSFSDALGRQRRAQAPDERLEADWTREGAGCLDHARLPGCTGDQATLRAVIERHCRESRHPIRIGDCDLGCRPGTGSCGVIRSFVTPGRGKVCQRSREACDAR